MKRAIAEISKSALIHNLNVISECSRGTRICAVVKADAYGHGAKVISEWIESGVDSFAVATVGEGIDLRLSGITAPVLILGYTPISEVRLIAEYNLTQTLISPEYARSMAAECYRLGLRISAHIKVDTGMHRLGFSFDDFNSVFDVCTYPCYKIEGIFSHFSSSDDINEHTFCDLQYKRLTELRAALATRGVKIATWHIANSAAIFSGEYLHDTVRAGIALYGYGDNRLIPVMTLKSHICTLRHVKSGERVGYSTDFIAKRDTVVATVPIGYADGVRRDAGARGVSFLVDGKEARCIGNVCMDYLMIDVTDISFVQIDSEVIIFGNAPAHTAESLAERLNTISYEILTSPSPRIERVYLN